MILTRYAFGNRGIIQAMDLLNDVDMSVADEQEVFDTERDLKEFLTVPNICQSNKKTTCWFTEAGLSRFADNIETIIYYLNRYLYGIGILEEKVIEYTKEPLYLDKYQAVFTA